MFLFCFFTRLTKTAGYRPLTTFIKIHECDVFSQNGEK